MLANIFENKKKMFSLISTLLFSRFVSADFKINLDKSAKYGPLRHLI